MFVMFEANLATIVIPVFDICVVPYKGDQSPPTPCASVTLQQLGTDVAVSWDACQSKSTIDK